MSEVPAVELRGITQRFGRQEALRDVSVTFRPGVITGLIGRNGAGKTTMAAIMAGWRHPSAGEVCFDGQPLWEDPHRTSQVCLMAGSGGLVADEKIQKTLAMQSALRPRWDDEVFHELAERLQVPLKTRPGRLSTGQGAGLRAAIALATRCEVTILDEIHLGMDAVMRRTFYHLMVSEYTASPRTIVLSSHLLDEVQDLLEDVVLLHNGRVMADGPADELRAQHSQERVASLTDVLIDVSNDNGSSPQEGRHD